MRIVALGLIVRGSGTRVGVGTPDDPARINIMAKLIFYASLIFLTILPTVASDQEDKAADVVASAFIQARQGANLSSLERMGRNAFRQKVCDRDMRFPSGWINDVTYQTSDPAQLPEPARKLAAWPATSKVAVRFGVGVCLLSSGPVAQPKFSVLIAIYESRWTSFWRIFWE